MCFISLPPPPHFPLKLKKGDVNVLWRGKIEHFYIFIAIGLGIGFKIVCPKIANAFPLLSLPLERVFKILNTPPPHFPLLLERGSNDYIRKILNRPHILHSHLREGSKYYSCNISTLLPPFSDFLFYYWRGVITYYGHTMLNTPSYF